MTVSILTQVTKGVATVNAGLREYADQRLAAPSYAHKVCAGTAKDFVSARQIAGVAASLLARAGEVGALSDLWNSLGYLTLVEGALRAFLDTDLDLYIQGGKRWKGSKGLAMEKCWRSSRSRPLLPN